MSDIRSLEQRQIDAAYEDFDALGLDHQAPGVVITFWVVYPDRRRLYAALWIADHWYLTGDRVAHGVTTEDFVAWLIERDVAAGDLHVTGVALGFPVNVGEAL